MREVELQGTTGDGVDENCNWSGPGPGHLHQLPAAFLT